MEKMKLSDIVKVVGGNGDETAVGTGFICKNPDHMNHNICCRCGWKAGNEGERTYCRKFRTEKGGDGKYHYFCLTCINSLALN